MTAIMTSGPLARALEGGAPVVALETTLIAHGIPRPRNLDLARAIEAEVRGTGALPATIGVIEGRLQVGLDEADLRRIALADDVLKCSTRDLARAMAGRGLGATTAAATMFAAARVGIRVMATGGLGGVHRGGEASLDVSADLAELGRSPLAVVCSGAKIVLDLPRTIEVLESNGVTVVGYGTGDLPGFYCRETGIPVPRVDGLAALAGLVRCQAELGWPSAVVVANPPPSDSALPRRRGPGAGRGGPGGSPAPGHRRPGRDAVPAGRAGPAQRRPDGRREREPDPRQRPSGGGAGRGPGRGRPGREGGLRVEHS